MFVRNGVRCFVFLLCFVFVVLCVCALFKFVCYSRLLSIVNVLLHVLSMMFRVFRVCSVYLYR